MITAIHTIKQSVDTRKPENKPLICINTHTQYSGIVWIRLQGEASPQIWSFCCWFWMKFFTLHAGYSESSSAGCKPYTVGFTALDDSSSTATAEIAVNGMDPPELGFSPAESTTGTAGQSRHITCSRLVSTHQLQLQLRIMVLSSTYI